MCGFGYLYWYIYGNLLSIDYASIVSRFHTAEVFGYMYLYLYGKLLSVGCSSIVFGICCGFLPELQQVCAVWIYVLVHIWDLLPFDYARIAIAVSFPPEASQVCVLLVLHCRKI